MEKIKVLLCSKRDWLRLILTIFLVCFIALPIITMLFKISAGDFKLVFKADEFYKYLKNSMAVTLLSAILSIILAFSFSYLIDRSSLKNKKVLIVLLSIPMLIPSISHGLGLVNLFGENGFLDKIFGINNEIYGFWGIVVGSIMYSFPIAFLMIYDAMQYENKSVYDVCDTLGISKFRAFISITLPYYRKTIVSSFFAVFTLIFTDYGVPMAIGGKYKTLSIYLYQEVINGMNFSKGAIIGIVLLVPALIAFIYDLFQKGQTGSSSSKALMKRGKVFNRLTIAIVSIYIALTLIPQFSFVITSFVKSFPNDMSFSWSHYTYAIENGMLIFLENSLIIALCTAFFGSLLVYLTAYLTTRLGGKIAKALHFISMVSLAIPGIVLGLGYVFLFKGSFIYGTILILIIVNIVHFFASPYLMSCNALSKLDPNFEYVGNTLGISRLKIFIHVIFPNSFLTIIESFAYFFVNSMITISAVAFLYTIFNMPISMLIPQFENQLNYEAAAAVSFIILITNVVFKILINLLVRFLKSKKSDVLEVENND